MNKKKKTFNFFVTTATNKFLNVFFLNIFRLKNKKKHLKNCYSS